MQKSRKRKQAQLKSSTKSPKTTDYNVKATIQEPFPDYPRPTPADCRAVRDDLLSRHGFPKEFIKYRNQRLQKTHQNSSNDSEQIEILNGEKCDDKESVLDGLVQTILSQNTTEVNSGKAFLSLKNAFPTWEDVLAAESRCIEDAIRCGGLAPTKSSCIKNILNSLLDKNGKLCLEYLRDLSVEEIKAELSHFKGIGPKTVSCVLMFHLQQDDLPVDTHVFQIAKTIGWVPAIADIKKTYVHLNQRIPAELKFDLNCLLYTHGKACRSCSNRKVGRQKKERDNNPCPLLAYCRDYC
ncbi:putative DNA glycosylase [Abeliophyllum distichum]|uniref:DNA glycosylase n=1 Tax=Abeliophyllum distichum TaxID=126358 RepID=A0ABD1RWM5_9LAMI